MDYWLANAIERFTINVLKHRLRVVVDMRDRSLPVSTLPPRPSTVARNPVHVRFHPSLREPTATPSTAPATASFASRSITDGASWSISSSTTTTLKISSEPAAANGISVDGTGHHQLCQPQHHQRRQLEPRHRQHHHAQDFIRACGSRRHLRRRHRPPPALLAAASLNGASWSTSIGSTTTLKTSSEPAGADGIPVDGTGHHQLC